MSSESKVVRYDIDAFSTGPFMSQSEDGTYVTHADYRALEGRYAEAVEGAAQLGMQVVELTKELAALRGKVGELVEADREWDRVHLVDVISGHHLVKSGDARRRRRLALEEFS